MLRGLLLTFVCVSLTAVVDAQEDRSAEVARGSRTAKDGFQNENDIRDKLNDWRNDAEAQAWLTAMGHDLQEIKTVVAGKPHGFKSDVEITVKTSKGSVVQGISIKLVSTSTGFNQIDKRWLAKYAEMWRMPSGVVKSMRLYLGEDPPNATSRRDNRMYLNELPKDQSTAVLSFFKQNKQRIVGDLLAGDGKHAAEWFMVIQRNTAEPRWTIRSLSDTIRFYADGPVQMTRAGNLKIGRISMQRKGGDNGRKTANMLQFKINPVQLLDVDPKYIQPNKPAGD